MWERVCGGEEGVWTRMVHGACVRMWRGVRAPASAWCDVAECVRACMCVVVTVGRSPCACDSGSASVQCACAVGLCSGPVQWACAAAQSAKKPGSSFELIPQL